MQDQFDILVVDDEPGIRITLAEILKDEGYNVVVAENGYKGIEAAEKANFKIAFIDMKMPGLNGIDTLKEIKKVRPDTIIFLMTAFLAEDSVNEAVKLRTKAIFYKPLDIDLILKILKHDLTKATILVVDDDGSIRDTLQGVLENCGYNVDVAEDGYTAIKMVKNAHFDILLVDVIMPGINGFQTVDEIKKTFPEIKAIMMSGENMDDFVDNINPQGEIVHIVKPFDLAELLQLIIVAIDNER